MRILLLIFLITLSSGVLAQKSRQQLEKEKKDNLSRIVEAERILKETEEEKKATLGQLQALQNQISARASLIRSMESEISLLESEINDLNSIISALENDLKNLKEEYAAMIYSAYKANQGYSMLTFLFSSSTFNELFMRLRYLDQYADARRVQAEQIEKVTEELVIQKSEVQNRRDEQEIILEQQVAENRKLLGLKTKQNSLVSELGKKESELRAEVDKRKKSIANLDKLIADIIEREARAANVADVADNANFESMRGKLAWPVSSGFYSAKFGRQPHPVLDNIYIENSGVGIQTKKGEQVTSVSMGTVTMVADSPGMQRVVMIRHGQYLTVYARLEDVKVKKGQTVNRGDVIGVVYTDNEGVSQLEFQVWKGSSKLDPATWLAKK